MTRCRNSSASRGSISVEEVRRKRRLQWMRLNTRVGGEVFGRYIRFGRGVGCPRYKGRSWGAVRGREVYGWARIGRLDS